MSTNGAIVRGWIHKALPWALLLGALWLLLNDLHGSALVESGTMAPPLTLSLDDGSHFELAEHRGQVVVVNFWATWCPPCRAEAPVLSRAHELLSASGGMVVGVSTDGARLEQVTRAARRLGMTYPIGQVPRETLGNYKVSSLPTTYVVGPDGRITQSFVGAVTDEELTEAIAEARTDT